MATPEGVRSLRATAVKRGASRAVRVVDSAFKTIGPRTLSVALPTTRLSGRRLEDVRALHRPSRDLMADVVLVD
jgi:hypothetical protein